MIRLYNPDRTLNRTEAWKRLDYWLRRTEKNTQGEICNTFGAINLLVDILRVDENERGGQ
jgi:hypothetical protein